MDDGTAYKAVAEILHYYGHNISAEKLCNKSLLLTGTEEALPRSRTLELLARIYLAQGRLSEALEKVVECLEVLCAAHAFPVLQRDAYLTKGRILRAQSDPDAARSYYMARKADPSGLTPGDILDEEVRLCFAQERTSQAVVETLASFSTLDRLTWMTWEWWLQGGEKHNSLQHLAIRNDDPADKQVVLGWYEEALRYLDNANAGAPLRYHLARFHLQIRHDRTAARAVLDEILDSDLTGVRGSSYKFTDEDPSRTLHKAILLQTDVLFQAFCASTDPAHKETLLVDVRALPRRTLAREVSLFSTTALLPHRLVIARMVRKVGPAAEFQRLLDTIITDARAALRDGVAWNDDAALAALGTALALLAEAVPSMKLELSKAAMVTVSARLEAELDHDDGNELTTQSSYSEDSHNTTSDEQISLRGGGYDSEDDESSDIADDDESLDDLLYDEREEGGETRDVRDDEEDDETKKYRYIGSGGGQIQCGGICNPRTLFTRWDEDQGEVGYQCTSCCDTVLCQPCYDALQANSRGDGALPRRFCGGDHGFIRAPVQGWGGIHAGMLTIDGETPVRFKREYIDGFLETLLWRAWTEFWRGG